jgi:hypothetical protein
MDDHVFLVSKAMSVMETTVGISTFVKMVKPWTIVLDLASPVRLDQQE